VCPRRKHSWTTKRAILREFTATANSSGQILIAFTTSVDNAQICGIEIIPNQPPAVWTQAVTKAISSSDLSNAVLIGNDNLYFAEASVGSGLNLQTLNNNNTITSVVLYSSLLPYNGLSLCKGNDGSTLFIGTTQKIISWNGTSVSVINDNMNWNSAVGFGMQIGTNNSPYVAGMGNSLTTRIWHFDGINWGITGNDINIPIGGAGNIRDKNFCITASQSFYTIGHNYDSQGPAVASLNGTTWSIFNFENNVDNCSYYQVVSFGNTIYACYTKQTGEAIIYKNSNSTWSMLPSMSNSTASGALSIANSPSGELFAVHIEGTDAVIKKYNGTTWQSVPASGNGVGFTVPTNASIQIVPGTNKCYAMVKTASEISIWHLPLN
jgi:hypothetical protein